MMEVRKGLKRQTWEEQMEITWLPSKSDDTVQRFMSRQPAWEPGSSFPWSEFEGKRPASWSKKAFGGHVYVQSAYAAGKVVEKGDEGTAKANKLGLHSIQGVFTHEGLCDRPNFYEASIVNTTRSISTILVHVRQPTTASDVQDARFPVSDADRPMGHVCYTCLVTFKRPLHDLPNVQDVISPQERYADILSRKAPDEWDHSPLVDVDGVRALFSQNSHGNFPMLDMYKVDMTEFNKDKPVPERRELILYRPMKPLPANDPTAHVLCHAYESDRNGLIMLANHLGIGHRLGPVASLSYGFFVHVNAEEAMMDADGWWIQEVMFPRANAGRGMMECRHWSPKGVHVASGYQDGVILPARKDPTKEKL